VKRAALAALVLAGCSIDLTVPSSGTEQETHVLGETARFAGMLGVRVRGELTDANREYPPGSFGCPAGGLPCWAAGWYEAGVAYYRRSWVVKQELANLTDTAAHEVCHSKEPGHNPKHLACCTSVGARPTYWLLVAPAGEVVILWSSGGVQ
jgi:hypothetical protein